MSDRILRVAVTSIRRNKNVADSDVALVLVNKLRASQSVLYRLEISRGITRLIADTEENIGVEGGTFILPLMH